MRASAIGQSSASSFSSSLLISSVIRASSRAIGKVCERADDFRSQIEKDAEKIASINEEAKLMLVEAEARLQMIEAAATRGSNLADSELALKKLSARSETLPIALEEARMTDEIKRELENELAGEQS